MATTGTTGRDASPDRPATQLACTPLAKEHQRDSFAQLRARVLGEQLPYVLASAETPHEIFDALGMPVVTYEWWGGVVSAKRMADRYLDWANEAGFHRGLGVYNALGLISLIADVADPPWGGLPRPALICTPHREQSAERVAATVATGLGVPYFGIEVPASTTFHPEWWELARTRWLELHEEHRVDIVARQYRQMIALAERIAGKRLDVDRLRAMLGLVNEQEALFAEARDLIAAAPQCPVRLAEQMSNVMAAQWSRGTPWAVAHARAFRDEVAGRVAAGLGVVAEEKMRLSWLGVGLWQNTDFYAAFERDHGAVFVWSMYLALAADAYPKESLQDPVRALAARYCNLGELAHAPPWAGAWIVHEARKHRVDGAVMLTSPGLPHQFSGNQFQKAALEAAGIPVLELVADPSDNRSWDEGQMRREVARFIEERIAP